MLFERDSFTQCSSEEIQLSNGNFYYIWSTLESLTQSLFHLRLRTLEAHRSVEIMKHKNIQFGSLRKFVRRGNQKFTSILEPDF